MSRKTHNLLALAGFALIATVCAVLYTLHADFPYYAHMDEGGKIVQVLRKERNFHHPTLMLDVVERSSRITREVEKAQLRSMGIDDGAPEYQAAKEMTAQETVELGRNLSAFWMASAVFFFCVAAYALAGWLGGVITGVILLFEPHLFYYAHFFKEEPVLMVGLAALLATSLLYIKQPGIVRLAFFAAACALAVSGKYAGLIFVIVAMIFVFTRYATAWRRRIWIRDGALFMSVLLGTWALLNLPILQEISAFQSGVDREWTAVSGGHDGIRGAAGFSTYQKWLVEQLPVALWALMIIVMIQGWLRRENRLAVGLILAALLVYFGVISLSPKFSGRYLLPVFALIHLLGAISLAWLFSRTPESEIKGRWYGAGVAGAAFLLFATLFSDAWLLRTYIGAFAKGSHVTELRNWVSRELPQEAVVGQLNWRTLPDPSYPTNQYLAETEGLRQNVMTSPDFAESGSLKPLLDQGLTHFVVTENQYYRYYHLGDAFEPTGNADETSVVHRKQKFFHELFDKGDPVWVYEQGPIKEIQRKTILLKLPPNSSSQAVAIDR